MISKTDFLETLDALIAAADQRFDHDATRRLALLLSEMAHNLGWSTGQLGAAAAVMLRTYAAAHDAARAGLTAEDLQRAFDGGRQ